MENVYICHLELTVVNDNEKDELDIAARAEGSAVQPEPICEILNELIVKIPALIRNLWWHIVAEYPKTSNGFSVDLRFVFLKDEDGDWAANATSSSPGTVEDLLLGMAKMIFEDDPIIDELGCMNE